MLSMLFALISVITTSFVIARKYSFPVKYLSRECFIIPLLLYFDAHPPLVRNDLSCYTSNILKKELASE